MSERSDGPLTTDELFERLRNGSAPERARACRELAAQPDAAAVPVLVDALEDEDSGVRWLAAVALIAHRDAAVIPILERLIERADSPWFREGAHHVLQALVTPEISPVVEALESKFPEEAAPVAANEALAKLHGSGR